MKIKGWEKINGITYKDYCMLNPIHNAQESIYYADVMNLVTKHKLVLELEMEEVFKPSDKYGRTREYFTIKLEDIQKKIKIQRMIELIHIKDVNSFRQIVEFCIEDYLNETDQNTSNGLLNYIQQSGTTYHLPAFDDWATQRKKS